jgi:predicted Zn-dependent peptidase
LSLSYRASLLPLFLSLAPGILGAANAPTLHDPDEPLLQLADTIYGSGFVSRLMKNIREDKGYSYHSGSGIETYRWGAIVQTHEDVRNAVTGASLEQTFLELNGMAAHPPSAQELLNGKRQLLGGVAVALHSRTKLADMLGAFWVQEEPADFSMRRWRPSKRRRSPTCNESPRNISRRTE